MTISLYMLILYNQGCSYRPSLMTTRSIITQKRMEDMYFFHGDLLDPAQSFWDGINKNCQSDCRGLTDFMIMIHKLERIHKLLWPLDYHKVANNLVLWSYNTYFMMVSGCFQKGFTSWFRLPILDENPSGQQFAIENGHRNSGFKWFTH